MNQCRHPGCIQVFDSVEKQYRHEQKCESRQAPSFTSVDAYYRECGRMPSMHTQALPLRTSFDAPSPPSAMSDITDSDESSSENEQQESTNLCHNDEVCFEPSLDFFYG